MKTPQTFVKLPIEVKAMRIQSDNLDDICEFMGGEDMRNINFTINYSLGKVFINTLEGTMKAQIGDWVIQGVVGEFYFCKPDIFLKTYRPVPQYLPAKP